MTMEDSYMVHVVPVKVKNIVAVSGGYREKDILRNPHVIERGETWNDNHKVVNVVEVAADVDGYRAGFAVDIVTRSIVG